MAINGNRSKFTADKEYAIDTFVEMFELSATDAITIQEWKALKAETNKTSEQEQRFAELTELLSGKIVTAEDWNKLCDCMVNLEKLYRDKGLSEIETTVRDYVANYAQNDINNTLDDYVNGLLLTNATKVIISDTAPAITDATRGALWIKPKS